MTAVPALITIDGRGIEALRMTISSRTLRSFADRFVDQYSDRESLREICALDGGILERIAHVTEEVLLERHAANSQIIKLIRRTRPTDGDLAGFYILYPINRECEESIEGGRIIRSREIDTQQICADSADAAAIYVSMVYGANRHAQAYVIHLLYRDIKRIARAARRIRCLYVRPVTSAGLRAVEKHGFRRFREDSGIYRRFVTPDEIA
ncbi:MAG TPA: hypothetical protein VNS63_20840 [Blastocatellia bacterium]|nr:hypothetical protein [Blastocatellia bacterium]